jgi:predicted N-formylglutamate amidohydrolase
MYWMLDRKTAFAVTLTLSRRTLARILLDCNNAPDMPAVIVKVLERVVVHGATLQHK